LDGWVIATATGWLIIFISLGLLVWGWRAGQLDNSDEYRYLALIERQPEPWPGREPAQGEGQTAPLAGQRPAAPTCAIGERSR